MMAGFADHSRYYCAILRAHLLRLRRRAAWRDPGTRRRRPEHVRLLFRPLGLCFLPRILFTPLRSRQRPVCRGPRLHGPAGPRRSLHPGPFVVRAVPWRGSGVRAGGGPPEHGLHGLSLVSANFGREAALPIPDRGRRDRRGHALYPTGNRRHRGRQSERQGTAARRRPHRSTAASLVSVSILDFVSSHHTIV